MIDRRSKKSEIASVIGILNEQIYNCPIGVRDCSHVIAMLETTERTVKQSVASAESALELTKSVPSCEEVMRTLFLYFERGEPILDARYASLLNQMKTKLRTLRIGSLNVFFITTTPQLIITVLNCLTSPAIQIWGYRIQILFP